MPCRSPLKNEPPAGTHDLWRLPLRLPDLVGACVESRLLLSVSISRSMPGDEIGNRTRLRDVNRVTAFRLGGVRTRPLRHRALGVGRNHFGRPSQRGTSSAWIPRGFGNGAAQRIQTPGTWNPP